MNIWDVILTILIFMIMLLGWKAMFTVGKHTPSDGVGTYVANGTHTKTIPGKIVTTDINDYGLSVTSQMVDNLLEGSVRVSSFDGVCTLKDVEDMVESLKHPSSAMNIMVPEKYHDLIRDMIPEPKFAVGDKVLVEGEEGVVKSTNVMYTMDGIHLEYNVQLDTNLWSVFNPFPTYKETQLTKKGGY